MSSADFKITGSTSGLSLQSAAGHNAVNGETLTLQLEASPGLDIQSCKYEVIVKSHAGATTLSLSNGGIPTPTPLSGVTVVMPGAGEISAWLIRCTVNDGSKAEWVRERLVVIRTAANLRKMVIAETTQYNATYGWASAFADLVEFMKGLTTFSGSVVSGNLDVTGNLGVDGYIDVRGAGGLVDSVNNDFLIDSNVTITNQLGLQAQLSKGLAIGATVNATLAADANDWAPTGIGTCGQIRADVTKTGGAFVTGIDESGQSPGQIIVLHNINASNPLFLPHQSTSSAANKRIICPGGGTFCIAPLGSVAIVYDGTTARWRVLAPGMTWMEVVLGSDVTNSTTSYADITGLTFPVLSGKNYEFESRVLWTCASTTEGAGFAVNGPTTTFLGYRAGAGNGDPTWGDTHHATYDAMAATSNSLAGGNLGEVAGIIRPSADGTVAMRLVSSVGGTAVVAKVGSTLRWKLTA